MTPLSVRSQSESTSCFSLIVCHVPQAYHRIGTLFTKLVGLWKATEDSPLPGESGYLAYLTAQPQSFPTPCTQSHSADSDNADVGVDAEAAIEAAVSSSLSDDATFEEHLAAFLNPNTNSETLINSRSSSSRAHSHAHPSVALAANVTSTQENWPGLAVWASNTVGYAIRNNMLSFDVGAILAAIDKAYPHIIPSATAAQIKSLVKLVEATVFKTLMTETSIGLGKGNRDVFHDIGYFFSLYATHFCDQPAWDTALARFTTFIAKVDPVTQKEMRTAFAATFQAHYATEADPLRFAEDVEASLIETADGSASHGKISVSSEQREAWAHSVIAMGAAPPRGRRLTVKERAERMLLGNMLVGLQEQTNLQQAIEDSIPAPSVIPWGGKNITINWGFVFTKALMTLQFGNDALFVGQDVKPRSFDGKNFGVHMRALQYNATADVYASMGGRESDLKGSGADDWVSLKHRMRFIAPLFRSRQDLEEITCHPFSAKQHAAIWDSKSKLPTSDDICAGNCCTKNGGPK